MDSIKDTLDTLSLKKKDTLGIVFVGHVDAGKSTIGGQVLNQLGMIDKRTIERYILQAREKNRESWYLSWALDTDEGERRRGKTAELGQAYFDLPDKKVILLDAPGHSMYVSDMIAGASQADLAVLVVSARNNEFESGFEKGGQTREHVYLSKASGITSIVVLINKMDEVDWARERFDYIRSKLGNFLSKMYGSVTYIPVSGFKGQNILERHVGTWYDGPSFLEYLNSTKVERDTSSEFSFVVSGRLKLSSGTYYDGRVETGIIRRGKAVILPSKAEVEIVGICNEEEIETELAAAGEYVKIRLCEDYEDICEGYVVVGEGCTSFVVSQEFRCMLNVLDIKGIICIGYQCVLHLGMNKKSCKIVDIGVMDGERFKRRRFVKKGERVHAKILIFSPIAMSSVGNEKNMGDMFALRHDRFTVALGVVKEAVPI